MKINFEKAFDSVNWEFTFRVLSCMKFDIKWIKFLNPLKFQYWRTEFLQKNSLIRGLRQRDPLSALLFDLISEVLCKIMKQI